MGQTRACSKSVLGGTKIISSYELARPHNGNHFSSNWESEASPTLGCSIEISRDIYIYMSVCLSWSKKSRRSYVGQTRACSKSVLGGKIRPVTPVLLEKWFPLQGELASLTKKKVVFSY